MTTSWGASIHDVLKNFGFFDPLPLVHIGQLIYSIKFTQPACLCLLFSDPPAPSRAETSLMDAPLLLSSSCHCPSAFPPLAPNMFLRQLEKRCVGPLRAKHILKSEYTNNLHDLTTRRKRIWVQNWDSRVSFISCNEVYSDRKRFQMWQSCKCPYTYELHKMLIFFPQRLGRHSETFTCYEFHATSVVLSAFWDPPRTSYVYAPQPFLQYFCPLLFVKVEPPFRMLCSNQQLGRRRRRCLLSWLLAVKRGLACL